MRNLIILSILLFNCAYCSDMLDVDYNFIEHAFEHTRPVSEQDFQKAINSKTYEPVPDTFGGKLKAFLFGRKPISQTTTPKQQEGIDPVSEAQIIKEAKNGIYFIKLVAPIISADNKVIPLGNYKIKEDKTSGADMLVFYQGHEEYGRLRLYRYNDLQKKQYDLTYSRVDIVSDDTIRIIYATIEDTKCAVAKVYTK